MADEIVLTPVAVTVTGTETQPLDQAIDVSRYDVLHMVLGVLALEGTTPDITVELLTSMQKDREDGWKTAISFTGDNDTFDLRGMARSWS